MILRIDMKLAGSGVLVVVVQQHKIVFGRISLQRSLFYKRLFTRSPRGGLHEMSGALYTSIKAVLK